MVFDFSNKTVFVSGGTKGIGKTIVKYFLELNAKVITFGRSDIDEALKHNSNLLFFNLNLNDNESVIKIQHKISSVDKIDICICCAGINIVNNFIDSSIQEFNKLFKINFIRHYEILQIISKKMSEKKNGYILNIGSIWSKFTREGRANYSISKSALDSLTRSLALELAPHNILVNTLSPGFTETELTFNTNTKEDIDQICQLIPIGRMAKTNEIAEFAIFLCSEYNNYITGQNIIIDGGYTSI